MSRARSRQPLTPRYALHIGEWITRLGRTQTEIARSVGITDSYLSELINNRKTNPSYYVVADIASELGIPVTAFHRRPPPVEEADHFTDLTPDVIRRLRHL